MSRIQRVDPLIPVLAFDKPGVALGRVLGETASVKIEDATTSGDGSPLRPSRMRAIHGRRRGARADDRGARLRFSARADQLHRAWEEIKP